MLTETLTTKFGIALPDGAVVVEESCFLVTTITPDDTYVERVSLRVGGCDVQVLRYDWNDNDVIVFVGQKAKQITMKEVSDYINSIL